MYPNFHQYFFDQIGRNAKSETVLAQEIMELLQQSKANVYKKMNGRVSFSLSEVLSLARHFGVSLDQFTHRENGFYDKLTFDYSLPKHQANTPEHFLEKVRCDMEMMARMPQARIAYASNEIPLFHSIVCRNLFAFKLFVWCRTNWKLTEMMDKKFDVEAFYAQWPSLETHRKAIIECYQRIPSKEYWSRSVMDNILHQIEYYTAGQFFADEKMPQIMRAELLEMLNQRAETAQTGQKTHPAGEHPASFDLYLNEIAYTNNIILLYQGDRPAGVYATMDNPNFLRSVDADFCQRMHQWIQQIETCSFHTSNERHRTSLFDYLKQKVSAGLTP